jgi:hypothetical protein
VIYPHFPTGIPFLIDRRVVRRISSKIDHGSYVIGLKNVGELLTAKLTAAIELMRIDYADVSIEGAHVRGHCKKGYKDHEHDASENQAFPNLRPWA